MQDCSQGSEETAQAAEGNQDNKDQNGNKQQEQQVNGEREQLGQEINQLREQLHGEREQMEREINQLREQLHDERERHERAREEHNRELELQRRELRVHHEENLLRERANLEIKYEADRDKFENEIKRLRADPGPKPTKDDKIIRDASWFAAMLIGDPAADIVAQLSGVIPLEEKLCNDKNGINTLPDFFEHTMTKAESLAKILSENQDTEAIKFKIKRFVNAFKIPATGGTGGLGRK